MLDPTTRNHLTREGRGAGATPPPNYTRLGWGPVGGWPNPEEERLPWVGGRVKTEKLPKKGGANKS